MFDPSRLARWILCVPTSVQYIFGVLLGEDHFFAEVAGKDDEVRESYRMIYVQVVFCVVYPITAR